MSERTSIASMLAAAVVAVAGLVPVVWLLASSGGDTGAQDAVAEVPTTSRAPVVTTVVVDPVADLEVAELDPSIVRVLQANGYAELLGESGLDNELPDAVTRVLIDHGAVLTVVEGDPAATEGSG
jgi:hypothetical protein